MKSIEINPGLKLELGCFLKFKLNINKNSIRYNRFVLFLEKINFAKSDFLKFLRRNLFI